MNETLTVSPVVVELPQKELCGLTQSQFKRFSRACHSTYGALGGDWSEAEPRGRSQKAQIECICDSDYIRMYGEPYRGNKPNTDVPFTKFYDEVIRPMFTQFYGKPVFMKMMKTVFPHSRYE